MASSDGVLGVALAPEAMSSQRPLGEVMGLGGICGQLEFDGGGCHGDLWGFSYLFKKSLQENPGKSDPSVMAVGLRQPG